MHSIIAQLYLFASLVCVCMPLHALCLFFEIVSNEGDAFRSRENVTRDLNAAM